MFPSLRDVVEVYAETMNERISGSGQRRLCKRDFWKTIVTSIQYRANSGMKFSTDDRNLRNSWSRASWRISRPRWPSSFISLRHLLSNLLPAPFSFSSGALTTRWTIPGERNTLVSMRFRLEKLLFSPGIENLPASVSPRSSLLGTTSESVRWSVYFASIILLLTTTISSNINYYFPKKEKMENFVACSRIWSFVFASSACYQHIMFQYNWSGTNVTNRKF